MLWRDIGILVSCLMVFQKWLYTEMHVWMIVMMMKIGMMV